MGLFNFGSSDKSEQKVQVKPGTSEIDLMYPMLENEDEYEEYLAERSKLQVSASLENKLSGIFGGSLIRGASSYEEDEDTD